MSKYYDAWKYLILLKKKYPQIDLDKVELKIKSIRNSKVKIGNATVNVDIKNAPGKLDVTAKIKIENYLDSDAEKILLFKGIKVKGKFSDLIRMKFNKRIYFNVKDILLGDVSIITGAYGIQLKNFRVIQ